jgi:peptidoglycan/LPS O-acetylase OafA/YrhL
MLIPKALRVTASSNRIFGLDLLRAFAIFTVVLAHSTMYISPKFTLFHTYAIAFDGVDIFFVLSGFLIGGILIRTLETQPATMATLWDFWLKRWIRTVPPYFFALLLVMSLGAILFNHSLKDYPPYFLFIQNLNWPPPKPYAEAWSLAVEEWFYLISAPSVFILTALRLKPKTAVLVAAATIIVATTLHRYERFLVAPPHDLQAWDEQFRKIVLLRLDSLMYGVLSAYLAYYYKGKWLKYKTPLFFIGLVWLYLQSLLVLRGYNNMTLFGCVFLFTCTALATTLMLPLLSDWKSSKGFIAKAVTHLSLVSYSLYLLHSTIWNGHFLLPNLWKLPFPSAVRNLIGLSLFWGGSLFFATLMYNYIEVPVMGLRRKLKSPPTKTVPEA